MEENNRGAAVDALNPQTPHAFTFFGCYEHSLDSKGRLIIPTAYRKPLGEKLTVTITPEGDGIALYPEETFDMLIHDLAQLNRYNDSVRRYLAYLAKMSYRNVEADTQGRILIPSKLRQSMLGDERELEISGDLDHVRIHSSTKGADEDSYFNAHRAEILQEVSVLKAGLMARKGDL